MRVKIILHLTLGRSVIPSSPLHHFLAAVSCYPLPPRTYSGYRLFAYARRRVLVLCRQHGKTDLLKPTDGDDFSEFSRRETLKCCASFDVFGTELNLVVQF